MCLFSFSNAITENGAFHRNDFNGTVSEQICELSSEGQLKQLTADCMDSSSKTKEVVCTCCTTCCEPGIQGICYKV